MNLRRSEKQSQSPPCTLTWRGFDLNCKTLSGNVIHVAWAHNFLRNHIHKKAQLEDCLELGSFVYLES